MYRYTYMWADFENSVRRLSFKVRPRQHEARVCSKGSGNPPPQQKPLISMVP